MVTVNVLFGISLSTYEEERHLLRLFSKNVGGTRHFGQNSAGVG
jgi:hypothetical protein